MASFHLFSELPFELRIHIWHLAKEPRTLVVRTCDEPAKYRRQPLESTLIYCRSPNTVPAILQTCREARNIGLYAKAFSGGLNPRYVWADFDLDTIQASFWDLKLMGSDKSLFQHLVVEVNDLESFRRHYSDALAGLADLDKFRILSKRGLEDWSIAMDEVPGADTTSSIQRALTIPSTVLQGHL
ncbi:hypothetical protein CABS01_11693 [Colletotrichum abscissum]|uniref:2EXR domain-containing protein n=1 Tax=Colletotrichum abscissum TaxID=1671311 RepID=A0A9Q0B6C6_9PEZI|nr:uncharacterized protein CABS01_11693 [Colletotrichum abscissum]KAI3554899.1 hypothetical protein CABS02_04738 [Colletotrichum abscissum]KAK1493524.1 hypothetical protein CABS01_11693 [Colletotrichum abscissum]